MFENEMQTRVAICGTGVLLAVVFFTSIALIYNRSAWNQRERLYDANSFVQATILAHTVLDEVDAKLFSQQIKFINIKSQFNTTRTMNLTHVGETYSLTISAVDADSTGVPLATPDPETIYTKVSVRVSASGGLKHTVTMSRLYTKTHLNL